MTRSSRSLASRRRRIASLPIARRPTRNRGNPTVRRAVDLSNKMRPETVENGRIHVIHRAWAMR
ncbi:hypothetical protein Rmet_6421 [Cupriavidus metallidurans CH34]|uniref:Uncharacterized protein n=1 Tax=Cupriavidus metallidurans (strain ATCC 43123 / DSM 2839 / NBRC 102507 / CH34) TaxID=266264 RepID=D3DXL9_CUPMC|nr:hypothetical protein Rmet_6421 [Cupriavidus metallidurans CH34]